MTGGEQSRRARGADSPCEAVALGKHERPHPCGYLGRYEPLYARVLCGHHLRVYERTVCLGRAVKRADRPNGRLWRDQLRGIYT